MFFSSAVQLSLPSTRPKDLPLNVFLDSCCFLHFFHFRCLLFYTKGTISGGPLTPSSSWPPCCLPPDFVVHLSFSWLSPSTPSSLLWGLSSWLLFFQYHIPDPPDDFLRATFLLPSLLFGLALYSKPLSYIHECLYFICICSHKVNNAQLNNGAVHSSFLLLLVKSDPCPVGADNLGDGLVWRLTSEHLTWTPGVQD